MIIIPINDELIPELEVFCKKAKELGYVNNSSLKLMRYDWCKENGEFYCAIKPGSSPYKGLNKGDWNSITQRDFIPKFIDYIPSKDLYISTNISNEHSGKALRNHKIMNILARQKDAYIIDVCDMMLNNVHQTIWKLNIEQYLSRRSKLNVV